MNRPDYRQEFFPASGLDPDKLTDQAFEVALDDYLSECLDAGEAGAGDKSFGMPEVLELASLLKAKNNLEESPNLVSVIERLLPLLDERKLPYSRSLAAHRIKRTGLTAEEAAAQLPPLESAMPSGQEDHHPRFGPGHRGIERSLPPEKD